ncbi:MAG: hypothetical protein WCP21_02960 [Armatimonadota bacterium]
MPESDRTDTKRRWSQAFGCACTLTVLVVVALLVHKVGQLTGEYPLSRGETERGLGLRLPDGVTVRCLYEAAPPGQYQAVARMDYGQFLKFVGANRLHWKSAEVQDEAVREYTKRSRLLPKLALWEPKPEQTLLMDDGRVLVSQMAEPHTLFVREKQKRPEQLVYAREVVLAYKEPEGTYVVLCIVYG